MTPAILVLNAGSSSVKFCLFSRQPDLPRLAHGKVSGLGASPVLHAIDDTAGTVTEKFLAAGTSPEDALTAIAEWAHGHKDDWRILAAAHRIVHGGVEFCEPVPVTAAVISRLKRLCPLAPLHQPHNLAALDIVDRLFPGMPQIACFDTAFHARHDPLFSTYALPQNLTDRGIRRYGFHGLSYEWIAHVLRRDYPHLVDGRVIAAHLGNGSSLCGMKNGRSVDTTMGMTALDGLPMGSRCGAIDPGAILYMIRDLGLAADEVERILYEESGLKGLSGSSNDVKILLASPDEKAKFALDYYALKVAQYMAMMAVSLGGMDTIVFTGGIGENAAPLRDTILGHLAFLHAAHVIAIPANEERMIAMHAFRFL